MTDHDEHEHEVRNHDLRAMIADNMNVAITRHSATGEDVTWDTGYVVVPSPQGMQLHAMLILAMKAPVLGAPSAHFSLAIDTRELRDLAATERVVMQGLEHLREACSNLLRQSMEQIDLTSIKG